VASTGRYEGVQAFADQVSMELRWDGPRRIPGSYLPEILDLGAGTGRRITAICSLRAEGLRMQPPPAETVERCYVPCGGADDAGRGTQRGPAPRGQEGMIRPFLAH
jgi:hypothetical protein